MMLTRDNNGKDFKKVFVINSNVRKGVVLERMQIATIYEPRKDLKLGSFIKAIVEENDDGTLHIGEFRELPGPQFESTGPSVFNVPAYLSKFSNEYVVRNEELGELTDTKSKCATLQRGHYMIPVHFFGEELPKPMAGFRVHFTGAVRNLHLQGIIVSKFSASRRYRYYIFVKGCTSYTDLAANFTNHDPLFPIGSFVDFQCEEAKYVMRLTRKNMTVDEKSVKVSSAHPEHLSVEMLNDEQFQLVMHDYTTGAEVQPGVYDDDWLGEFCDLKSVLQPNTKYKYIKLEKVTDRLKKIAWVVADARKKQVEERKAETPRSPCLKRIHFQRSEAQLRKEATFTFDALKLRPSRKKSLEPEPPTGEAPPPARKESAFRSNAAAGIVDEDSTSKYTATDAETTSSPADPAPTATFKEPEPQPPKEFRPFHRIDEPNSAKPTVQILRSNVERHCYFEDEQVRLYGSSFAMRSYYDNLLMRSYYDNLLVLQCYFQETLMNMASEKRWPKRDAGPTFELRCCIDQEVLRSNVERHCYFEDEQVRLYGSVFAKRTDYDNLLSVLPRSKFNGIHIKMEDDCPQGGDDVRLCLLKSLGAHNLRSIPCVGCHCEMIVYDKYPLVDGVFYLSAVSQYGPKTEVLLDGRRFCLQQLCVRCLWSDWSCRSCGQNNWFQGRAIILGTLYYYDIVSAGRCCPPVCNTCKSPLMMRDQLSQQLTNVGNMGNYAPINEPSTCSTCGTHGFHLVRDINNCILNGKQSNSTL